MFSTDQTIPCPVCNNKIPFDTKQLLMGVQFSCPNCSISIGLPQESKHIVEETMQKFDELKTNMAKQETIN
jgi:transcription initiation factor IIE alpha subunit